MTRPIWESRVCLISCLCVSVDQEHIIRLHWDSQEVVKDQIMETLLQDSYVEPYLSIFPYIYLTCIKLFGEEKRHSMCE